MMATEVGGWRGVQMQINKLKEQTEGNINIRTRDLLGAGGRMHKEIDLDLHPPMHSGWEKRLDMKSGKVYFHNCNRSEEGDRRESECVQDLNFPPPSSCWSNKSNERCRVRSGGGLGLDAGGGRPLEEHNFMGCTTTTTSHENSTSHSHGSSSVDEERESKWAVKVGEWQSVCTLDKVKMALERADKEVGKRNLQSNSSVSSDAKQRERQRQRDRSPSSSSCSSLELSLYNQHQSCSWEGDKGKTGSSCSLLAAGCPRCLLYVLLPKTNPKCPRCGYLILNDVSSSSTASASASACKRPRLSLTGFMEGEGESGRGRASNVGSEVNHTPSSFLFDLNTAA